MIQFQRKFILFYIFFTLQFSFFYSKILTYTLKTHDDLKKVFQISETSHPHIHSIPEVVHHQRRLIVQNGWISSDNSSSKKSTLEDIDSTYQDFFGCGEYETFYPQLKNYYKLSKPYHSYYTSLKNNLYCVKFSLTHNDYEALLKDENIHFTMLEPIPQLLRVDSSIGNIWLGSITNLSFSKVDNSRKELKLFNANNFNISLTNEELNSKNNLRKLAETFSSDSPILNELVAGKKVGISVMFQRHLNLEAKENIVEKWKNELTSSNSLNSFASLSSYFNTKSSKNTQEYHPKYTPQPFPDPAKIFRSKSETSSSNKLPLSSIISPYLSSIKKYTIKSKFNELKNSFPSLPISHKCGFDKLSFTYNKYGVYLSFPVDLTQYIDSSSEYFNPSLYSQCLSLLTSTISLSPEITSLGLSKPMSTQNNIARDIVQNGSKLSNNGLYFSAGLNGTNFIAGVADTGIDEESCFFKDYNKGKVKRGTSEIYTDLSHRKVIQYVDYSGSSGDYSNGHGTHVAGTLLGYCSLNDPDYSADRNYYMGMAPGAKVAFFDIGMNNAQQELVLPLDLGAELFPPAQKAGAKIHSNSWGGGFLFDGFCIETDEYLYKNDDMLIFFAAGNSGSQGMETVLSPSLSKNSVAVGCTYNGHVSSYNIDYIAPFSSHGPTMEGRIKPDIVAPGYSIQSAKSSSENSASASCQVEYKAGTSMSTPVVSGNSILIQEYFSKSDFWAKYCNPKYTMCKKGAFVPSGYLLKALVLHSGRMVTAYDGRGTREGTIYNLVSTPDFFQGYGRMDLTNILPLETYEKSDFQLFVDTNKLKTLTETTYTVSIIKNDHPLKVTLSWFDPPNSYFASRLLLHDLDLVVTSPSGVVYFGNALIENGKPASGSSRDEDNNNEQVVIPNPEVGDWTVSIQSKQLTESDSQKFAIVITANGVVTENQSVKSLSLSLLQKCNTYQDSPMMEIGISYWSRITTNGWSDSDIFNIYAIPSETSLNPLSSDSIYQSSFQNKYAYEVDGLCLSHGCYTTSLNLSGKNTHIGTQVSVPQCGVYLTPMATTQDFCISNPISYSDEISGKNISLFSYDSCKSTCSLSSHYSIPLVQVELAGSGWNGAYYSIMSDKRSQNYKMNLSENPNFATSDGMEWGMVVSSSKCLPISNQCYVMSLQIPSDTEDLPELYFKSAFPTNSKSDLSMKNNYNTNNVIESMPTTADDCPYYLNSSVNLATFCTSTSSPYSTIKFYRFINLPQDFGLGTFNQDQYDYFIENALFVGKCVMKLDKYSGMSTADVDTEDNKEVIPTQEDPSNYKLDYDKSYSCFSKCSGYPGDFLFQMSISEACFFLTELFNSCDSFSIAYGMCSIPKCMSTCSTQEFCYFSSAMITSCGIDLGSLDSNRTLLETTSSTSTQNYVLRWDTKSAEFSGVFNQCTNSYSESVYLNNKPSTSNNNERLKLLFFVFLAICVGGLFILITSYFFKVRSSKESDNFSEEVVVNPMMPDSSIDLESPNQSNENSSSKKSFISKTKELFSSQSDTRNFKKQKYEMVPISSNKHFTIEDDDSNSNDSENSPPLNIAPRSSNDSNSGNGEVVNIHDNIENESELSSSSLKGKVLFTDRPTIDQIHDLLGSSDDSSDPEQQSIPMNKKHNNNSYAQINNNPLSDEEIL